MSAFYNSVLQAITYGIQQERGSLSAFAKKVDVLQPTMHYWFTKERSPNLRDIGKVMDYLGVTINCPWEHPEVIKPSPEESILVNDLTKMCNDLTTEIAKMKDAIIRMEGEKAGYERIIYKFTNNTKN